MREKFGITDEMVALPIVPVIEIPGLGNEAAAKVCRFIICVAFSDPPI
jgi:hypothetical protein